MRLLVIIAAALIGATLSIFHGHAAEYTVAIIQSGAIGDGLTAGAQLRGEEINKTALLGPGGTLKVVVGDADSHLAVVGTSAGAGMVKGSGRRRRTNEAP